MLFYDLFSKDQTDTFAIIAWDHSATWQQMATAVELAVQWIEPLARRRIGFRFSPSVGGFATLAALDFHQCDTTLLDEEMSDAAIDDVANELRFTAVVTAAADVNPANGRLESRATSIRCAAEPGVTILTSGTEGRPKAARHIWDSLARPVRQSSGTEDSRWLLAFRPQLYAGLQVILQCFCNHDCLVVPKLRAEVPDIVHMIVEHRVQCLSATPSYWRRLLLFSDEDSWRDADLRQITLGGEIVDQQILDALHQRFTTARIVHIFATTELGRCFAIADGKAGFPAELLQKTTPDGVGLKVRDGVLWARSANAMRRYGARFSEDHSSSEPQQPFEGKSEFSPDDWLCTGDLVQVVGDRVFFAGRQGDTINVGGNKVQPFRVESLLRGVTGVADVRVFGVASSITGQLVACQVVPASGVTNDQLRAIIQETVNQNLATHERPRFVEFKDHIELTKAGKISRTSGSDG